MKRHHFNIIVFLSAPLANFKTQSEESSAKSAILATKATTAILTLSLTPTPPLVNVHLASRASLPQHTAQNATLAPRAVSRLRRALTPAITAPKAPSNQQWVKTAATAAKLARPPKLTAQSPLQAARHQR